MPTCRLNRTSMVLKWGPTSEDGLSQEHGDIYTGRTLFVGSKTGKSALIPMSLAVALP